ncbi:glycosyltransferase [Brachybacterium fresconis]|uniref:Glycosyltransferase involved in cell wall biosynthesis n=1 Tax=Brachybacterium fresconis TaxID=173363 RepID=A0ABS4YHE2_9MICO|nr:glycosyltransferase [Brachybacterium fresconis]MBP2408213.1 glycosyltransferase involved in cell wall biosynthesis [Brachybacterium fresconis]
MTSLLIASFSTLTRDPRVQRQIDLLAAEFEVTTVGFGTSPHPEVTHIELPEGTRAWPSSKQYLLSGRYRRAYWDMSAVRAAREALADRVGTTDIVLANDVNTLPLALWLAPRLGVHADLHEYAPREKEHVRSWRWFVAPYQRWICRTCLPEVASITTVSPGLADEYAARFGVDVQVVTNASAYEDRAPRPTGQTIRLLHTGVARANRRLESMIDALRGAPATLTLDLMLVPSEPGYIEALRERASDLPAVTFRDPVAYTELVDAVAEYDVSIVVFPATTFNLEHSLPNKLFEAVQARTAVLVGPSPDMAELVREHGLGRVLDGADAASLRAALETMTPADVDRFKHAADAAATELSAEHQIDTWRRAITAIAARR